jgi:hypothetical protein
MRVMAHLGERAALAFSFSNFRVREFFHMQKPLISSAFLNAENSRVDMLLHFGSAGARCIRGASFGECREF